jgi:alpha-beta hydrolase superfamily lysophospholipase
MIFRRGARSQAGLDLGALSAAAPEPICITGRAPGVLAFHGFGGTTREIELAATVAGELGLSALARTLPGHGSHARDLARTRFADWVAGAESAYRELAARGPVIAAGISMGSLLAAQLAIEHPEQVRGLVMLANAAWLRPPLAFALRASGRLRRTSPTSLPETVKSRTPPTRCTRPSISNAQRVHCASAWRRCAARP